jgi:uncharacterized membrane protein YdjX (TVP38/TMEM64 family)
MPDVTAPVSSKPIPIKLVTGLVVVAAVILGAGVLQGRVEIAPLRGLLTPLLQTQAHAPFAFALAYFAAYVATTALCIPLEVPFALGAGALFGLAAGVVLASFASVFGASLAFLGARFLLREPVRRHFAGPLDRINKGIERDGIGYLVNLRLLPVVPFSLCNPLMGLTTMSLPVFFIVSQACMIFATIIFVNAGTQLWRLHRIGDILSPRLVIGLAALALLPWLGKGVMRGIDGFRHRRINAR